LIPAQIAELADIKAHLIEAWCGDGVPPACRVTRQSIIAPSGQIEAKWVHRLRFDRVTASIRYPAVATPAGGPAAMAEAA
jgi:hypothetical protein